MNFIKQPQGTLYTGAISGTRYKYSNTKAQKLAFECIFNKNQSRLTFTVDVQLAKYSFEYISNIIAKWDERSKKLNGWKNCWLTLKYIRPIYKQFKVKFELGPKQNPYLDKKITFRTIQNVYQQLSLKDNYSRGLNQLLFAILVAVSKHRNIRDFENICDVLEIMAQNQLIYCICSYKSRGNRAFYLPWECPDDPVIHYRKQFKNKINRIINKQTKANLDFESNTKQSAITKYFKPKLSKTNCSQITNDSNDTVVENDSDLSSYDVFSLLGYQISSFCKYFVYLYKKITIALKQ